MSQLAKRPTIGFDRLRAIEIIAPAYGTGYRIGGRLVLTAAHVVATALGAPCSVRERDSEGFSREINGTVTWLPKQAANWPAHDVALIQLAPEAQSLPNATFGILPETLDETAIRFILYGFPSWARTKRNNLEFAGGRLIYGDIFLSDHSPDNLLPLEPARTPNARTQGAPGWQGVSGAAVLCGGLIVAVQRQQHNPSRETSLEAVLLRQFYDDPKFLAALDLGGVRLRLETVLVTANPGGMGQLRRHLERYVDDVENWATWSRPGAPPAHPPAIPALEWFDLANAFVDPALFVRKINRQNSGPDVRLLPVEPPKGSPEINDYPSAVAFLKEWVNSQGRSHLTLLGDAGSGKTSLLLYFGFLLARWHLEDPTARAPLFISLGATTGAQSKSVRTLIEETAREKYGIALSFTEIQGLLVSGQLTLLLDGFDEMVCSGSEKEAALNFESIKQMMFANGKTLLTSRRHYFRDASDAFATLTGNYADDPLIPSRLSDYEVAEIRSFDAHQVSEAISKRIDGPPEKILWQIYEIPNSTLIDLIRRPLLLDLVLSSLDRIKDLPSDEFDLTSLYESYVAKWMGRDKGREGVRMERGPKLNMMRALAWTIFEQGGVSGSWRVGVDALRATLKEFSTAFDASGATIGQLLYETTTCSFLNRDPRGGYGFIHRSFFEFFLADAILAKVRTNTAIPVNFQALSMEVFEFLRGRLLRDSRIASALHHLIGPIPPQDHESLAEWLFWRDALPPILADQIFAEEDTQIVEQKCSESAIQELPVGQLISVKGGHFIRGSWQPVPQHHDPHMFQPPRLIEISDFAVATHLVTNQEFAAFVEATGYVTAPERGTAKPQAVGKGDVWAFIEGASWKDPDLRGLPIVSQHPVVQVSWTDAKAYCTWLGHIYDKSFRLLTEAEWEYLARGKLGRRYPWGNAWLPNLANSASYWAKGAVDSTQSWNDWWTLRENKRLTCDVGTFPPNAQGINDLVGNAWEWTEDWYSADYYLNSPSRNPWNSEPSTHRVIRGGAWDDQPHSLQCFWRYAPEEDQSGDNLGFRIAMSLGGS